MKLIALSSGKFNKVCIYNMRLQHYCKLYRGERFRKDYSHLGELRALIPPHVHIMALTATATIKSRQAIVTSLGMDSPFVISVSPHKKNVLYVVRETPELLDDFVFSIVERLVALRTFFPRTIIFCRRYQEC